ncbi:MAG: ABC transporter ATP-binding protein [Oscillospiraceae bacterium]|nr:ABC transporter ATP-binding protein [Oscillospiraceae bacterium]
MDKMPILNIDGLSVSFAAYGKGAGKKELRVISNLSINAHEGEILAVAGASGSGKSLLAMAILGILPRNAKAEGAISYKGKALDEMLLRKLRGREIAFVPQSVEYLDPMMRAGKQVSGDKSAVEKVFERYRLDKSVSGMFPFQLSGGMARRILCATAVVGGANLIIADEPTPGMSKELATRAMKHFRDLANEGAAVMLITHDLSLALGYTDRVAIFYAGTTAEIAFASDFECEDKLRHPYTKALWRAMPENGFSPIPGSQPLAGKLHQGCLFEARCDIKTKECIRGAIKPRVVRGGEVCCLYAT